LQKILYVVFTALVILTAALFAMSAWTHQISYAAERGNVSSTQDLQYIDDPLVGSITIHAHPVMYEFVTAYVSFNISLAILGHKPMNLSIYSIKALFTPANEPSNRLSVGTLGCGLPEVRLVNASYITIRGGISITPVINAGWENVCLGMSIEYALVNYSLTEPYSWGGTDGTLFMIPVTVIPAILRPEGWTNAIAAVLSLWGVVIVYSLYRRSRYP